VVSISSLPCSSSPASVFTKLTLHNKTSANTYCHHCYCWLLNLPVSTAMHVAHEYAYRCGHYYSLHIHTCTYVGKENGSPNMGTSAGMCQESKSLAVWLFHSKRSGCSVKCISTLIVKATFTNSITKVYYKIIRIIAEKTSLCCSYMITCSIYSLQRLN